MTTAHWDIFFRYQECSRRMEDVGQEEDLRGREKRLFPRDGKWSKKISSLRLMTSGRMLEGLRVVKILRESNQSVKVLW